MKPSVNYKEMTKNYNAQGGHTLEKLDGSWMSGLDKMDNKLLKINADQKRFYETTKDEFRNYKDLNKNEIFTESTAHPTHDESIDSEAEYMKETSTNRVSRNNKSIAKPKNRFKTFDRLFQRENSKTVTKFQKVSKIIKDFNRKEFDNRMFEEVYNAVNQPQTLELKKEEIQNLLTSQNKKLVDSFKVPRPHKSRTKSALQRNNLMTWNCMFL